jgi:hypothetical protein
MKRYAIHITISAAGVLLAVGHIVLPNTRIDATTLVLIGIAILPWLGSIFKSVEFPGGLKVEYADLEKTAQRAKEAGLLATPVTKRDEPAYIAIAQVDPNLALAGLRIEIERRLQTLAQQHDIEFQRQGIGHLMRNLRRAEILSPNEESVLNDLTRLLNEAVHGAAVDQRAAQWAIEIGPELLATLDKRAGEK